jgi:hypothetical protein
MKGVGMSRKRTFILDDTMKLVTTVQMTEWYWWQMMFKAGELIPVPDWVKTTQDIDSYITQLAITKLQLEYWHSVDVSLPRTMSIREINIAEDSK